MLHITYITVNHNFSPISSPVTQFSKVAENAGNKQIRLLSAAEERSGQLAQLLPEGSKLEPCYLSRS